MVHRERRTEMERKDLHSILMLLLFLLSAGASGQEAVTVYPGEDVILPCLAADSTIGTVKWSRPDLVPDIVLYYRDGHLDPTYQHPSFKDRVELVDRDLKDGDVSLNLKAVNINDNGTYVCRIAPAGERHTNILILDTEPIRIIRLQVTEPAGSHVGNFRAGNRHVYVYGYASGGLLIVIVIIVLVVYVFKSLKKQFTGI